MDICVLRKSKETWTGLDFKKPILIFLFLISYRVSAQSMLTRGGNLPLLTNLLLAQQTDSSVIKQHQAANLQVWLSLSEVCMISRYYAKELNLMHTNLKKQGVFLGGFFPNAFSTDSSIKDFQMANQLLFPLFKDSLGHFAKAGGIRITPEVLVLNAAGQIQYKGRIDDFYVAIGRHKTRVSNSYLKNALNAILKGEKPTHPFVEPVGCVIDFSLWESDH